MKAYFAAGVALIVFLIASLLGYGVYLNHRGENRIAERMADMRVPLSGVRAGVREISPKVELELINLYSDDMTDVTALESGRITMAQVERNTHVTAGQPILTLTNEDIPLQIRQADSDILEAEAQLMRAEHSFKRYAELMELSAVSAEKYDEAEAAYKAARARLENYRAHLQQLQMRQDRLQVRSPIEGEVLRLYQKVGAYVTAGTAVALVGDFSRLYFTAPVEDRIARRIAINKGIDITFDNKEMAQKSYGGEYAAGNQGLSQVFHGHVAKITPPLEEEAAVRQVVWEIDNSVGILEPGVYPRAVLRPNFVRKCLAVPRSVIINRESNEVAVMSAAGTLERRSVVTGASDGTYIEIIQGLSEGDVVITSDTDGIKDGVAVDVDIEED